MQQESDLKRGRHGFLSVLGSHKGMEVIGRELVNSAFF